MVRASHGSQAHGPGVGGSMVRAARGSASPSTCATVVATRVRACRRRATVPVIVTTSPRARSVSPLWANTNTPAPVAASSTEKSRASDSSPGAAEIVPRSVTTLFSDVARISSGVSAPGASVGDGLAVGLGGGVPGTSGVRFGGASGTRAKSALLFCVLISPRSALRRRSIIVVDEAAGAGAPRPPALDVALPHATASAISVGLARRRRRTAPPVAAIPSLHVASAPAEKLPRLLATSSRVPAASGAAPSRLTKRRVVVPLAVV